ncbi:bifunctional [glutamate--ammonia ligase]-adenylyl-L-tyrosine phosphorylase/[glutamate--ammonia-ligase] adenylyltransferase [Wenzhouxiangella marina]|uniref:Uncharacterized protein n=1 Tax=Wenzhouxiangella marina TaxID=1579979 RepID=A0A0K0XSZ1_9GAMM|nr:bifunctional [glutamate--ammonia ligase]-adenylyl-L-tyrosine phosphorylase/[glutamate--ammonia-ligase] adenylyltransferase [Wenzhouxiangella marina]AKS40736.1 hypothetical protein WM2015_353 [Wenzhouxiangella marina]MBB6087609.1 glutamate-ammonia-ligase adenylyltransferase [Wenzhouxiangella marina]
MSHAIELQPGELRHLSRFVDEAVRRWPEMPPPEQPVPKPAPESLLAEPERTLRRFRQQASIHILWRDLTGLATIEDTGAAISALARECIELALTVARARIEADHGQLLDSNGEAIGLAVIGMGKLGGNELNFNSDIDLVFVHRARGQSDGRRRLDSAAYLKKLALELIRLLDAVTADGRVWVVDTRLRPFGDSGALVWSLGAMEQYFLNEGRAWERYAWLKADAVAGDLATGRALIEALQPFVFRRYLDYGIFDSLRELHAQIDAKSRADSQRDDIKRGPGGIRELEFLIQSQQILRGGREAELRVPGFLPALRACRRLDIVTDGEARELADAYRFLRILENRLQAMTGRQGHHLPEQSEDRERLARLMGETDWGALSQRIDRQRERVRQHFSKRFKDPHSDRVHPSGLWPPDEHLTDTLEQAGFEAPAPIAEALQNLHRRTASRALSAEGRRRLERLMPELLDEVVKHPNPDMGLAELLRLIEQISRRSAYLALLHERPATLERLVRVFRSSPRLAEWIIAAPQLLDDLLDPIHGSEPPDPPRADPNDTEASLHALGRWRQAGFLRTALAELDGQLSAVEAAAQLASVAETAVNLVLALIREREVDLAVIAYGNLGAGLLHFESDLDLVFLHGEGPAPVRTAQRLISFMQLPLPGGRLFEIDTRLRPNGRSGLLVSRLDRFADYQASQAWTWEHQALIRARWVAGNPELREGFDQARARVLTQAREASEVRQALGEMRQRQRAERPESTVKGLLTDLQFIAECGLLCSAHDHPDLIIRRRPDQLLEALGAIGWLEPGRAAPLIEDWSSLLGFRHRQWLERDGEGQAEAELIGRVQDAFRSVFDLSG